MANPLFQTPRRRCVQKADYDLLDLTEIPEDYLPRTNYVPACGLEAYRARTPGVPWDEKRCITDYYRIITRSMLSQAGERTLISAIAPLKIGHVHTSNTLAFEQLRISCV